MKLHPLTAALLATALSVNAQTTAPKAEVRAVWLTTNGALDWPSTYNVTKQKKELTDMLDRLAQANFNTILFQVQAKGDVAWKSNIQPAMRYITGDGSKGLSYDVSQFVIDECHKRGMECHAWIVTYRIGTANEASYYANNAVKHPYNEHSGWCRLYSGAYYLDPCLPEVREYLVELYREMLTNYDFDGVNFDYTRYPGTDGFTTDERYFAQDKYNPEHIANIEDWRRWNINTFIADFYEMAKTVRPDVKVGCAPFGTYKNVPGYGNTTAYGSVYQDAVQWATSGHMDIVIPQMYWNERYGFTPNMGTWVNELQGHTFVVGLAPYKMTDTNDWDPSVVYDQIEKIRAREGASGACFFRADHVIGSNARVQQLYSELCNNYYRYPAHIPPITTLEQTKPSEPANVSQEYIDGRHVITWDANPEADRVRYYTVYLADGSTVDLDDPSKVAAWRVNDNKFEYSSDNPDLRFAVTAFDQGYYESNPSMASSSSVDGLIAPEATITYSHYRLGVESAGRTIGCVDIFAINGSHVMSVPVNAESVAIECGDMSRGVYIARITYADGGSQMLKIIR